MYIVCNKLFPPRRIHSALYYIDQLIMEIISFYKEYYLRTYI